jgi:hypothetical protein
VTVRQQIFRRQRGRLATGYGCRDDALCR